MCGVRQRFGRNAFVLPDEISFEIGAIMMCSSATARTLNKARLKPGESIAFLVWWQDFRRCNWRGRLTATRSTSSDQSGQTCFSQIVGAAPLTQQRAISRTNRPGDEWKGRGCFAGVDQVAKTMRQAVQCLGALRRAALVGLTAESMSLSPCRN
jgi:propanol-preferring alcohol dehydrogenase